MGLFREIANYELNNVIYRQLEEKQEKNDSILLWQIKASERDRGRDVEKDN